MIFEPPIYHASPFPHDAWGGVKEAEVESNRKTNRNVAHRSDFR